MGKHGWVAVWVAVLALFAAPIATAGVLYGTTGKGGTPSTLVEIDPVTGGLVGTIGPVGYVVNGLAFDPTSGKLYGSTSVTDPGYNGLIEIDLLTGAGTPVGTPGWGLGGEAITNLTFNSLGMAFGWWDPGVDSLVAIDKGTGVASLVGPSGIGTAVNGLAFDNFGTLWMVNVGGDTYTVDPGTGATSFVGSIGTTAHHGVFDPMTNLWFGLSDTGGTPDLVVADLGTLTVVDTLSTAGDLHTLAFELEPAAVPEPGTLALVGAGLLGMAFVAVRRRRKRGARPA